MKAKLNAFFFKIRYLIRKPAISKVVFIVLGISSTIWFLIRVIPKPQRATYPCMRAAAPLMSTFVIYLLTLSGSALAFRKAKNHFKKARYIYAATFFSIAIVSAFLFLTSKTEDVYAGTVDSNSVMSNSPVGVEHGIFPGRVVWVFDPEVATWDGSNKYWWDEKSTLQVEADKMLSNVLISLTGEKTEAKAWDALFKSFNEEKKKIKNGYSTDQKIAIKINQNNTNRHADTTGLNASPQLVYTLIRSLTKEAGVPQKNITIFDASRFISDNIFNKCHKDFPEVLFVDNEGGNGRIKSTYVDMAIPYSVDNGKLATGLATCAVEADYIINMALLKGHIGQGVTLCGKNFYGATSIDRNWRKNAHDNFNQDRQGKDKYMTFTDFLGHKDLGGKTLLFLIDGFYGARSQDGPPLIKDKWRMAPFNNRWCSSLFASQDGVALDAVGIDFLRSEWPDLADIAYSEKYLVEAALADNPPSKTFYDPERDGTRLNSLGVMEHWNNADEKKYSRNLGKNYGIELVYIPLNAN
ncbi:MAG: DUF362 domain-containing protein [Bacteroidia bacterium]|nr:DUF362 domain-containing protein [Bacteroidia bacterium]